MPRGGDKSATPASPPAQTVRVQLLRAEMSSIPVPFDPKVVFGKARAPVKVTLNGYSYRSTIFTMHGRVFIPLRASHREAAGVADDATLQVKIELDTAERAVELPPDLRKALTAAGKGPMACWKKFSYTRQREFVEAIEGAKKPETRARRIAAAIKACTP